MDGMNARGILVTKRNGDKVPLDLNKFHKVVMWACEDIAGVSASEIELRSHIQFYDGIKTKDIQETLIKASGDLISDSTPNYQYVAGRLINYALRKEVYGGFEPTPFLDLVKKNVENGKYDKEILTLYTEAELNELGSYIKYDRDNEFTYVAMEQMRGKYLVQNRITKEYYETPQVMYMMIGATLFSAYTENRLRLVKDFYDAVSTFKLSLPTPIMAGLRTPTRQFSSCVLIESDDSLASINATSSSIVNYISQKAGIGINAGRIRALGQPIRNGDAMHTGLIPFLKLFQASVKSCSQGGVRGGAATVYLPGWHLEFEDLVVLKNNKGTENNRVRQMDYAFQLNKLMYTRLITGGDITLFSPEEVPDLYDAFFQDQDKFEELYEKYERSRTVKKKTIPALEYFQQLMSERKDTGRIYIMNVDNANTHGSFVEELAPIRQSNLCTEINLPTKPLNSLDDEEGEISLCTLSAINWGAFKTPQEMQKTCEIAVRALDALLDYQNYPVRAAEISTMNRRPLGVGIINFAYFLAKNGVKYDESAFELVDEWAQHWSYYLIKASVDLAKEKGSIPLANETKYASGILPVDTYKKDVDDLVPHVDKVDWAGLREELKEHGIRNSTLMALMPAETSAQISNSTNGIEPPRALVSEKQSKDGVMKQVVPGIHHLKNKYDLLWEQKSPQGYIKLTAILQKYIDQGISVNTSYNPKNYEEEKVPMSALMQDLITCYKYGHKQLYYNNTFDGQGEIEIKDDELPQGDDGGDEVCDSCTI
jgi:ribonucleoside-diphosphate reductase alpha chain